MNVLNYAANAKIVYRFGSSQNKLFDYMASGKPILSNVKIAYNLIEHYGCGVSKDLPDGKAYAEAILQIYRMDRASYEAMCQNALCGAKDFDFAKLTARLFAIIQGDKE